MNKIYVRNSMNYYPKWTLTTILVILLLTILATLKSNLDFSIQFAIISPSLILFGLFTIILSHKNGFILRDSDLLRAYFIGNIPLKTNKIDLSKWTSVSILTASKRMGNGDSNVTFSPDSLNNLNWSYREKYFRLTLLNQNHTIKSTMVTTKSESEANNLLEFILNNTDLKYEIYSPNFSKA